MGSTLGTHFTNICHTMIVIATIIIVAIIVAVATNIAIVIDITKPSVSRRCHHHNTLL